jgi:hypothetical protein
MRYLRLALTRLSYELSPDRIWDLLAELSEEGSNVARHTANSLKLFIKTVLRGKNLQLVQSLYNSFKVPKSRYKYRPQPLTPDTLRRIFESIDHLGAKAFFLLLAESGLWYFPLVGRFNREVLPQDVQVGRSPNEDPYPVLLLIVPVNRLYRPPQYFVQFQLRIIDIQRWEDLLQHQKKEF